MFTSRRSLLATAAAAVLATSLPMAAPAAEGDYPNRPITIVVPHAPGGPRLSASPAQADSRTNTAASRHPQAASRQQLPRGALHAQHP